MAYISAKDVTFTPKTRQIATTSFHGLPLRSTPPKEPIFDLYQSVKVWIISLKGAWDETC